MRARKKKENRVNRADDFMDRCGFVVQNSLGIRQSRKGFACAVAQCKGLKAGAYRIHTIGPSVSLFPGSLWSGSARDLRRPGEPLRRDRQLPRI